MAHGHAHANPQSRSRSALARARRSLAQQRPDRRAIRRAERLLDLRAHGLVIETAPPPCAAPERPCVRRRRPQGRSARPRARRRSRGRSRSRDAGLRPRAAHSRAVRARPSLVRPDATLPFVAINPCRRARASTALPAFVPPPHHPPTPCDLPATAVRGSLSRLWFPPEPLCFPCSFSGAPERTRTSNLQIRSLMLYPIELRARRPPADGRFSAPCAARPSSRTPRRACGSATKRSASCGPRSQRWTGRRTT
jgi:hypothetical protein